MPRNWTAAQQSAIDERSRTLLVSAAAGSGKTAVLTERIIRSLLDREHPADISRILVVTFTRAAAGELRQKISKALFEAHRNDPADRHLEKQLMLVGSAPISTIDSFYLDLVREHFEQTDLPASFRPVDADELLSLRREIMNGVVDEAYCGRFGAASSPLDFRSAADALCDLRQENSLTDTLLEIYQKAMCLPDGVDTIARSAEELEQHGGDPLHTPFGKVWENEVREWATAGYGLFSRALDEMGAQEGAEKLRKKFFDSYTEMKNILERVLDGLAREDYAAARTALATPPQLSGGGKPGGNCSDEYAALVAMCDDFRKAWCKYDQGEYVGEAPGLSAFSEEEVAETAARTAEILRVLHAALTAFDEHYRAAKAQREVAEFSDISRAAYRLLIGKDGSPTALAAAVAAKYDAVYIDEYQDVDEMQDATFRAISSPTNRFMVGDIKQSIYRFRGAQPKVFARYRRDLPPLAAARPAEPAMIFMSNCFRCDDPIIRFSNTVSGHLFSLRPEAIGYTPEDDLHFSKTEDVEYNKCRVVLVNRDKDKKSGRNPEMAWIAQEIARLLREETHTVGGKQVPLLPKDIAVLMRKGSAIPDLERELSALGIKANDTSKQNFFENADVLCVYSLLAALDNPMRDVYLAAALRSPFFGFTLEDLIRFRLHTDERLSLWESIADALESGKLDDDPESAGRGDTLRARTEAFLARFDLWRKKAQTMPVDRFLRYLYRESAILSFAGRDEGGDSAAGRRKNLHRLYEYARTYEASGFKGLYQFIRYVDGLMENDVKMSPAEGEPDAVSLITIHHSKGLEYPVCFIAGTGAPVSGRDTMPKLLCDGDLGCACRLPNAGPFSRAETFFRNAIVLSLRRQSIEEEMRVLYVAMTRAKSRLYITATPHGNTSRNTIFARAQKAARFPKEAFLIQKSPSFFDWILAALSRADHDPYAVLEEVDEADFQTLFAKRDPPVPEQVRQDEIFDLLKERFSYRYPYRHLTALPAKLSVSKLSPGVLDVYDPDAVSPETVREKDVDRLLHVFEKTPLFGAKDAEKEAAARGTATHEFLQFCDFARAEQGGAKEELERLIEAAYLSPETRELVRFDELERFFASDFYRSLKGARELHRETRFHLFLPAADFAQNPDFSKALSEEKLAVQGVIDLFYTDGDGKLILCDYKTDRLTDFERAHPAAAAAKLSARHGEQLSYYARALEAICGRRPDRVLIYSLPLGEAVEADLAP